jgi:hypothetical protein
LFGKENLTRGLILQTFTDLFVSLSLSLSLSLSFYCLTVSTNFFVFEDQNKVAWVWAHVPFFGLRRTYQTRIQIDSLRNFIFDFPPSLHFVREK